MITLAWYLLKVIICSGILCGYYFLALRNKVFHRWNRFYLLAAIVISLVAPVMKINIFQNNKDEGTVVQMLQTISYGDEAVIEYSKNSGFQINTENLAEAAYLLVSVIFLIIFFVSLYKIKKMKKKYPETRIEDISFISTNAKGTPFSFFKSIFWNNAIDLHSRPGQQIFNHEIAHVKEKHSYDKIFMNLVLIFFWINPIFWLMRKELYMIHEFIADKEALEDSDINAFAEMILQTVYPGQNFSITNSFFYSPIKRRIMMLTKNKNPKVNYYSRLLVLPLAAIVFFAFTLKLKNEKSLNLYDGKLITVVIDAGHGGQDNGAISADGIKEKDITLSIANKIADLNSNPDIKILLSRNNNQLISVKDRVLFSKDNDADLFISLHVNGSENKQLRGFSVLIDKENSSENMLLGSALIDELKKSHQTGEKIGVREKGVWVLDHNVCPAALIECGFLSNSNDEAFITDKANQEKIAQNILDAINVYASSKKNGDSKSEVFIDNSSVQKDTMRSMHYNGKETKNISVQSTSQYGILGNADTLYISGSSSKPFSENSQINTNVVYINSKIPDGVLIFADGKEISEDEMKKIAPNKIGSINLLKGETAKMKYGPKGKGGAIEITTKKSEERKTTHTYFYFEQRDTLPDKVYTKVEVEASFPGGLQAWTRYISRAIADSISKFRGADYGTCVIRFIVNVDGRVSDVVATTMKGTELAKVSVNAIKNGPKWIPASQNGHTVAAYRLQPVTLKSPDQKKSLSGTNADLPKILLDGSSGGRIPLNVIEDSRELKTSSDKYSVASFTVYFSGANFPYVKSLSQHGGQFNDEVLREWEKIKPGTSVTFDDVKVQDNSGNIISILRSPGFTVTQPSENSNSINNTDNNQKVFIKREKTASFPGGQSAWLRYISKVITQNGNELTANRYNYGTCKVRFIVDKDGKVSDVQATTMKGTKLAEVAVNAIRQGPKWIPGEQNGHVVNSYLIQPVTFSLKGNIAIKNEPE